MRTYLLLYLILSFSLSLSAQNKIPTVPNTGYVNYPAGQGLSDGHGTANLAGVVDYKFTLQSQHGVRHEEHPEVAAIKNSRNAVRLGQTPYDETMDLQDGFEQVASIGSAKTANLQIGNNFSGFNDPAAYPNDNDVAVSNGGTVITVSNTHIDMYSSSGSSLSSKSLTAFFGNDAGLVGLIFDPKIVYDDVLDRFFLVALVGNTAATSKVILAASTTTDPATGNWNYYYFNTSSFDNTSWFDYPTIGLNDSKFFLSGNTYLDNGTSTGTVMLMFNKTDITNGVPSLNYNFWLDLKDNNNQLGFTIHPVTYAAAGNYGPNALFISTFAGSGSVFQMWTFDNVNTSIAGLSVAAPQYQIGSDAAQSGSAELIDVGDCRTKGATYIYNSATGNGTIHFVFISVFNGSGVRNGVVKATVELTTNGVTGAGVAAGFSGGDFAHPGLACLGNDGSNTDVVIVANFSSAADFPGSLIFSIDGAAQTSAYLTLKDGVAPLLADADVGATKIRWGDYLGASRKKNTGNGSNPVVWVVGSHGSVDNRGGTWLAEVTGSALTSVAPQPANNNAMTVYPNPTAGNVYFDFSLATAGLTTIRLYSITGAQTNETLLNDKLPYGKHKLTISTSDLAAGTYVIEVLTEAGERFQEKVVVQ